MSKGFAVQPDKLEDFQNDVDEVAKDYSVIVQQLNEALLRPTPADPAGKMHDLLGTPERLGPSGPPVDFTESSRTMLENYDGLLDTLAKLHAAVHSRFKYMYTALDETRESYTLIDDGQAVVFQNLLNDGSPDGS